VYFGGGTPSQAPIQLLGRILDRIRQFGISETTEVTLEVNPSQTNLENLNNWKSIGINRLSIGVQSLRNQTLQFFGRDHTIQAALKNIEQSRKVFDSISLDFIWGVPNQTRSAWHTDLETICDLGVNHLSLYQLTVERGTNLYNLHEADMNLIPNEDIIADLYDITRSITCIKGYQQYEVSSFCKNNAKSKHNLSYWKGMEYVGIGAGSHGKVTREDGDTYRTFRIRFPADWIHQVEQLGHGIKKQVKISENEIAQELIVFGLRTFEGLDLDNFSKILPQHRIDDFLDIPRVMDLSKIGLLDIALQNSVLKYIRPTLKGIQVVDRIIREIIT
jgi:oxygen-independent coproporphyrinogen-3 oxidase